MSVMVAKLSHLRVLCFLVAVCNVSIAGQNLGQGIQARQETDPDAVTDPAAFYSRAFHACMVHAFRIPLRLFTDTLLSYRRRALPVHRWRRHWILRRRQSTDSPGYVLSNPVDILLSDHNDQGQKILPIPLIFRPRGQIKRSH
jgi:hypothetical protein